MKKLLLLLSLFLLVSALFADYVEIGDGVDYTPVQGPFYNYYKCSHAQTLYFSEELGGANTFTSLSFNLERMSANYPELPNFTVKILAVELDQFADGAYYDMTGATEVFSETAYQLAADIGWFDIDITDFDYDGTSDLIVDFEFGLYDNYDTAYYRNFKTASPGVIRMLEGHDDTTYPATFDTAHEAYSNIRFNFFVEGAPGSPVNPMPENSAHTVALTPELSWEFGADTEYYDVIIDSIYPPMNIVVDNATAVGTTGTFSITEDLDFSTKYYWRVISRNSNTRIESYGPIWSFETIFAPVDEDFETNDFTAHDWQFEGTEWTVDDSEAYSAYHSATSGLVPNGTTTSIYVEKEVTDNGEISFAHRSILYYSSDYNFYINDELMELTETLPWEYVTYPITAGSYTFKWEITSTNDADQVWLDYISFPPTTVYENDMAMRGLEGATTATAGTSESYHVTVKNIGSLDQSAYTVKLMQEGDIELSSIDSNQNLIPGEIAEFDLIWDIPANLGGDTYVWSEVVLASDDNMNNNINENLDVYIYAAGTSVILSEGFEAETMPGNWSSEYISGSTDWNYQNGGQSSNPSSAHTGEYNARFYNSTRGEITQLITPELNLGAATPGTLEFWHTQKAWGSDQDELRVLYKNSAGGEWTELANYTSEVAEWTYEVIELPNPSTSYFVAFEGISDFGYGVCLDDVVVTGTPTFNDNDMAAYSISGPEFSTAGNTETFTLEVKNNGNNDQSAYTVKLMEENGTELLSVDVTTPIASMETVNIDFIWTIPENMSGEKTLYGKVVLDGDENDTNDIGSTTDIFIYAAGTTVILSEGFEDGAIPEGWTSEIVNGATEWNYQSGGQSSNPSSAHTGEFNARFYNSVRGEITRLISPELNLGASEPGVLEFWHTQKMWASDQDELKILYKNSPAGQWQELVHFTAEIADWTMETIELPNPSTSYYVAFEGFSDFGYGVCVDDIFITGNPIVYDNDMAAYGTTGPVLVTAGTTETYNVTVKNVGNITQTAYTVKLMQVGDVELASLDITEELANDQVVIHQLDWNIPDDMPGGFTSIYAQVSIAVDDNINNNMGSELEVNVLPFGTEILISEDFESGALPAGWQEEYVTNGASWSYMAGGNAGNPGSAHDGAFNALFYDGENTDSVTRLVSPEINLGTSNPGNLTFWHAQKYSYPSQDFLRVLYKTSPTSDWVELANFTEDVTNWTERSIPLPVPSTSLYIAFEGTDMGGSGVCVDDVVVTGIPVIYDNDLSAAILDGPNTINAGGSYVYNFTVRNVGNLSQDAYSIKLLSNMNSELATLDITNPIAAEGEVVHNFVWNVPADYTPGTSSIHAKVIMENDDNPGNNQTPNFPILTYPAGYNEISIGNGTEANNRIPLCFQYNNSITETIYFEDEMNALSTAGGIVESMTYYSSFANDITDSAIKIWLGHTELETLEAGWIPSTDLTLVYDNTMSYSLGENDVTIDLETPFLYEGGNLVVMVLRPFEETAYTGTDNFYVTETVSHMDRTRYNRDNEEVYDAANPPEESFSFEKYANVKFIFTMGATSSITGYVYAEDTTPLAGAEVLIEESGRSTFTDGNGMYILDSVLPETYTVTASAFGYETSTETIVVGEEETVTQDFTLAPLGVVTVSGQLVGSDLPDAGIADNPITLSGYQLYETTTDASGNFSFAGVYTNQTYSLTSSFEGYQAINLEVVVEADDVDLDAVVMQELTFPVSNIVAVQAGDESLVDLTWNTPGSGATEFRYDDGTFESSVGDASEGANAVFGATHNYNGVLSSMSWYLDGTYYTHPTVNLYILGLDNNNMPDRDNVLFTATQIPNTDDEWNEYLFPAEVVASEGFFIGICTPNIYLSIGLDDGVDDPYEFIAGTQFFSTNWTDETEAWQDLGDLSPNYARNFMIRAQGMNFGELRETRNQTINNVNTISKEADLKDLRELVSYNVYRFPSMYQSDPTQWMLVGTDVSDSLYTDTTWISVPVGNYRFAVTAVHTNDVESIASFSNIVEKTFVDGENPMVPAVTRMNNNYPNPFNPSTTISFSLKEDSDVTLSIYNIRGELVNTLVNEDLTAGSHQVVWEGKDSTLRPVASGVYFYKMRAGRYTSTKKMILMK